ncbi:RagB/SusD family nutrient uptake outer membrane protein [Chitinophaga filiformis]|uniref:RagB/SusD family nutrient uptake outer membrane protein n=1 Tax=Chitinophaga filiformis TaxID=104663 RepID=UPI001F43B91C|nr:RagB/SusD family nutrient uptake outer membrane protein [Chitinophaga filiformis]MCF6405086.1 RagB/SusD family nutrient uptake outer membrane protein [Chitinophaga filiformis]
MKRPFLLTTIICCLSFSCNLLNVDNPANKAVGDDLFKNKETAEAAVLGIYSAIAGTSNIFMAAITYYSSIYADEAFYTASTASIQEFYNGAVSTTNTVIETNFWNNSYRYVYQINTCLEKLEKSTGISDATRNQLSGECHFLRAFIYFHMLQLFGEVPLITVTDYRVNENMPRTTTTTIRNSILSDLERAKKLLSDAYPTNERVRPNKSTASALLARYYLHQQQWQAAEQEASEIVNTGRYQLTAVDDVFLANSAEAIFQIQPVLVGYNTMEGNTFIPSDLARPNFALTTYLRNAFEVNDKRWKSWVASKVVNAITYYYPFKYKKKADFIANPKPVEYNMIFRLAEILLIRAECRVHLNSLPGAIADLDAIRLRAGLPLIQTSNPGISAAELSEKIAQERRIELFMECGHRWSDLKRTGKASETLQPIKSDWKSTRELWPIPQVQRALNPALTQNDGY